MKRIGVENLSKIIVLVGASGSGKSTIGKELEKHGVRNLLSFTTREQRSGEQHMVDYRFIGDVELGHQILLDNVVEMTKYNGNTYGLLKRDVDYIMSSGSDVYFICDKNGAEQISKMYPEQCTQFFIKIDMETMMDRMLKRGDDVDSVLKRIYHAYIKDELKAPLGSFVLNSKYFNAVENAECILNCIGVDE